MTSMLVTETSTRSVTGPIERSGAGLPAGGGFFVGGVLCADPGGTPPETRRHRARAVSRRAFFKRFLPGRPSRRLERIFPALRALELGGATREAR